MSIEAKIEALTAAIVTLTAKLESSNVALAAPVAPAPAPVVQAAPVTVTVVDPVPAAPAPVVTAPGAVTLAMPAPPSFIEVVAPAPAPAGAPFTDAKGLMDYVLASYKSMGQEKGAMIQGVLTTLGYQNINEIKPEHYSALYAGVEALK
jgi:hypothetical protein